MKSGACSACLAADARALMRKGEAEYTELGLDAPALGQDALIAAMAAHPRLIERPIVVHGDKAVIGRPPEKVLAICNCAARSTQPRRRGCHF
jgi:arsenate reductase